MPVPRVKTVFWIVSVTSQAGYAGFGGSSPTEEMRDKEETREKHKCRKSDAVEYSERE